MKRIVILSLSMMLMAMFTFINCTRRTLEDDIFETALIPVRIDWSVSGVNVEEMHRATLMLFPINGGLPIEYRLEGNLTERQIAVPVGTYSVIAFNETIDEDDWKTISFTNKDSYEKFAAVALPEETRGFYTRSESLPLVANPEVLAAWSLDKFEVTRDMITQTRTNSENGTSTENQINDLTSIKPSPRFERVIVKVFVKNLSSSIQATGTIDGMASGVYMASGNILSESVVHAFVLNGRVYDDNGNDGTTTRTFNIFGRDASKKNKLNIDFLLADGTLHPRQEFDVSKLIYTDAEQIIVTHFISLGYNNMDGDHEIELPDSDLNAGVTVEDWDEVIVPL